MKKTITLVMLTCVFLTALVLPTAAAELRGLWVDAYHPGFYDAAQTAAMVAKATECNFNTLFVQVRRRGDVFYSSAIEPMAWEVAPGYDPLADIVAKAHAAGIKVHAWLTVYEVFNPSKWARPNPRQVHLTHPEWLMKDVGGDTVFLPNNIYLDPGIPGVQTYLAGIVAEIVKNYKVDGIHLDGVRYPSREAGYAEASVAAFNKANRRTGKPDPEDPAWCNWRRSQVNQLISLAFQKLPKSKRKVLLSAAVSENPDAGYALNLQDCKTWVKSGSIDFVVPMVFASDDRVFQAAAQRIVSGIGARYVCIGQAGFKLGSQHSVTQLATARALGVSGVVIYNYHCSNQTNKYSPVSLLDLLKTGLFASPDTSTF